MKKGNVRGDQGRGLVAPGGWERLVKHARGVYRDAVFMRAGTHEHHTL